MAGRWRDPSAFRADPAAAPSVRPSRRQTISLLAVLVLVAGAVAVASYAVRPDRARAFELFHGSLFLADQQSPVAVDLATGKPTLRLVGADKQVSVTGTDGLGVVPLDGGTLLLNRTTGEFNMVDSSGFVIKHDGGGVPLGQAKGTTSAIGIAAGDLAYVVRNSDTRTDVFLVSQATVTAAINATGTVKPRASTATTDGPIDTDPGGTVSADRALWALVQRGGGDAHVVRRFTYPATSNPGVQLSARDAGTVTGPGALATATTTAGSAVALASSGRIRFLQPQHAAAAFDAPAGLGSILPASNADGRFAFLLRGGDGWSVLTVSADGTGLRGPRPLTTLPADPMAAPAYSGGALYTVDQSTGVTYRIGLDGAVSIVAAYPVAKIDGRFAEPTSMADGYVVARASRVVVNSPTHENALMVFTDGSRPPLPIVKSSAVGVSAAGGAEELTRTTAKSGQPPHQSGGGTKPKPAPVQVVNPHLECTDVTQKPHIPILTGTVAGSRSVTLSWNYPIIDRTQDCFPTTYVIDVKSLNPDAPSPRTGIPVESQVGATITGLFPNTRYLMRVTAYIHESGTSTTWFQVLTGKEGPAAPTDLTVAADNAGNWLLQWNSCGDERAGCVPAESWTVTPSFCDGRGLSAPPAALTAPADPSSREQPPFRYPGSDALLGRGLQFIVTGSGTDQTLGTPSVRTPCVVSWTTPTASAMTLTASKPANSTLGDTTSTTVRLDVAGDATRALGGVGAKLQFVLTGPDGTHIDTQTYTGTGNSFTSTFAGLRAGVDYRASAVVSAPGHPEAAVQLGPQTVTPAADWPNVTLDARCDPQGDVVQLTCGLVLQLGGITSAAVGGETFDIIDTGDTSSGVRCSSATRSINRSGIDPAAPITDTLSLLSFTGTCTATLVLRENGPVFGGALKTVSTQFTIGSPTTYDARATDWDAQWDPNQTTSSQALINYKGTRYTLGQLAQITQNWTITVRRPGSDTADCGSWSGANPPDNVDVPAAGTCVNQFGDSGGWSVDIGYQDPGTGTPHVISRPLDGPPPSYQPCTPTDFAAAWGTDSSAPTVTMTVGGQLAGCGNWTYDLRAPDDTSCPVQVSGSPDSVTLVPSCTFPPGQGRPWTIQVSWTNPAGDAQGQSVTVEGDPPQ